MVWFNFAKDFDFSPAALSGRVTTAYMAGTRANVTHECADLAEAAGSGMREADAPAAKATRAARKKAAPVEKVEVLPAAAPLSGELLAQVDGEEDRRG